MRARTLLGPIATLAVAAALAGCAPAEPARAPLTQRQRDSVMAASPLPGAPVVGRAMTASDDAARRAAALDSLAR